MLFNKYKYVSILRFEKSRNREKISISAFLMGKIQLKQYVLKILYSSIYFIFLKIVLAFGYISQYDKITKSSERKGCIVNEINRWTW